MAQATTMPPQTNSESYADGTPLVRVFGDGPRVRIVAALLSETDGNDLNVTDLARLAGISRNSVYRHVTDLLDLGVVVETRTVGNSSMYAINEESEAMGHLAQAEWAFVDEWYTDDIEENGTAQEER